MLLSCILLVTVGSDYK